MAGLSTADCRNWLVADAQTQQLVADNSGHSDYLSGAEPLSSVQMTWVTNAKKPGKWKRQHKYKVGSQADKDNLGYDDPWFANYLKLPTLVGGVIRIFWLEDTDHVTVSLLELNGKIYFLDDLSD